MDLDSTSLLDAPHISSSYEDAFLRLLQRASERNRTKTQSSRRTSYRFQGAGVSISKCWAYTDLRRAGKTRRRRKIIPLTPTRRSRHRTHLPHGLSHLSQKPDLGKLYRLHIVSHPLLRARISPNRWHSLDRTRL